jgi:hypothetical protein
MPALALLQGIDSEQFRSAGADVQVMPMKSMFLRGVPAQKRGRAGHGQAVTLPAPIGHRVLLAEIDRLRLQMPEVAIVRTQRQPIARGGVIGYVDVLVQAEVVSRL